MNSNLRMDKSAFKIIYSKDDIEGDIVYWLEKSEQERIDALEFLRWQYIHSNHLPEKLDKSIAALDAGK